MSIIDRLDKVKLNVQSTGDLISVLSSLDQDADGKPSGIIPNWNASLLGEWKGRHSILDEIAAGTTVKVRLLLDSLVDSSRLAIEQKKTSHIVQATVIETSDDEWVLETNEQPVRTIRIGHDRYDRTDSTYGQITRNANSLTSVRLNEQQANVWWKLESPGNVHFKEAYDMLVPGLYVRLRYKNNINTDTGTGTRSKIMKHALVVKADKHASPSHDANGQFTKLELVREPETLDIEQLFSRRDASSRRLVPGRIVSYLPAGSKEWQSMLVESKSSDELVLNQFALLYPGMLVRVRTNPTSKDLVEAKILDKIEQDGDLQQLVIEIRERAIVYQDGRKSSISFNASNQVMKTTSIIDSIRVPESVANLWWDFNGGIVKSSLFNLANSLALWLL